MPKSRHSMRTPARAVYLIANAATGKRYVGCTKLKLNARLVQHFSGHATIKADAALHGRASFAISALQWVSTAAEGEIAEAFFIRALDTLAPRGYNRCNGKGSGYALRCQCKGREHYHGGPLCYAPAVQAVTRAGKAVGLCPGCVLSSDIALVN
jgi:hypothetical protein